MTVVVGYIFTPEGEAALAAAIHEAQRRGEPIHVLNVGQGDAARDERFLVGADVDALDARLRATGVEYDIRQLVRGREPAEEIVDTAHEVDASMIVIGLRRRTPTGKLL